MISPPTVTRFDNKQTYQDIFEKMRDFTHQRTLETPDAIWLLEHHPVFTQGQAGKKEHVLDPKTIPVIQSDRGGQVTYHGPGQLMIYTLVDLKRLAINIREYVTLLEQTVIKLLNHYGIKANTKENAPGVYVNDAKICSLGLRVRHGRTYHGLSLNVKMDLSPFSQINPCGFAQLPMTQISDFIPNITLDNVIDDVVPILISKLTRSETIHEW